MSSLDRPGFPGVRRSRLLYLAAALSLMLAGPPDAVRTGLDTVVSLGAQTGVVFESNWQTATGTAATAITDGGKWSDYQEFNGGSSVQLLSVVAGGVNGHNALRVLQRGPDFAASLQVSDFIAPSTDYYLRYYMRNDDTSNAGDSVVTVDSYHAANLIFLSKSSSTTTWRLGVSLYGCGYTYPIGHWSPARTLARGQWYRFEYFVDFRSPDRVQVHPRVYDAAGTLVMSDADFRQSDYRSGGRWKGRDDWTLASYYAAGHDFCVDPAFTNDLALGNYGQTGAIDTGLSWYFSALQIRTDSWPGPADGQGSLDTTSPVVSVTAPAGGATVSGTVTVSAAASDNVGVAGVQFKLDGANLGAEDISAPYGLPWDTTAASNGGHTLTAVARDAAGNQSTSEPVTFSVSNVSAPPPTEAGLASGYPGDAGITGHPDVVFAEQFESTLSTVFSRWTDVLNGPSMSLVADVPAGSSGTRSLRIPWSGGGVSNGGHLYKQLPPATDRLYVRYYIKYPSVGRHQHNGIWMGGYNPALSWPNPRAGLKPVGNDRFSAAAEQAHTTSTFDHYDYWMNMRQSNDGRYWGNVLLNNPEVKGRTDQWMCVEHMVKLNTPLTESNGEHAIWLDGVKVSHLGPGYPRGFWSGGNFTQDPAGTPFEGFRWRSDGNLNLNWIWLQTYAPNDPAGVTSAMTFDHVVVARSYIGCLTPAAPPAPVATVAVAPASATIAQGATQQFTATARDANGNVLSGRVVTWASANTAIATVNSSGVATGVAAGSTTITATSEGHSGTAGITVTAPPPPPPPPPSSATWPNEPAGFTVIEDTGWETGTLGNWYRIFTSSDKPISVVSIPSSAIGETRALQIAYAQGHSGGGGTELRYNIAAANQRYELYVGYYVQVNPQWQGHSSAINKMLYLHDGGTSFSAMWYEIFGSDANPLDLYVVNQSGSSPSGFRENVNQVTFVRGQWHKVEIYQKQGASNNGIVRVWVDGKLAIDRSDIDTRSTPIDNVTISGIWGGVGDSKNQADYMRFDRIRISRPGS